MKVLLKAPVHGWMLQLEWKVRDFWVGAYWRKSPRRIDVWVCLVPCLPLHYASPVWEDEE